MYNKYYTPFSLDPRDYFTIFFLCVSASLREIFPLHCHLLIGRFMFLVEFKRPAAAVSDQLSLVIGGTGEMECWSTGVMED